MRLIAKQARRAAMGCGALAAALLLGSCGGGGDQVSDFKPTRIIAFGDETSVILDIDGNANGHKFSVNGTTSATAIDCHQHPLWIQLVATAFGTYVFPTCNPAGSAVLDPPSRIRATVGARAADLATQIDAQLAESAFEDGDLVTVLVGANDVFAEYAQYPNVSEVDLTRNVETAGTLVGRQVNRLADMNAKVIISTIPDVGLSPFAIAERFAHIDTDRQKMIQRLVEKFNAALRAEIVNDGRRIGLVLMDESVQNVVNNPGAADIEVVSLPACDLGKSNLTPPSILDCTDFTLNAGINGNSYLWADDRHLASGGQQLLGNAAANRAKGNPF
jgi:lysophospholipase L1-like esterase